MPGGTGRVLAGYFPMLATRQRHWMTMRYGIAGEQDIDSVFVRNGVVDDDTTCDGDGRDLDQHVALAACP
jgi:hypothetical protein